MIIEKDGFAQLFGKYDVIFFFHKSDQSKSAEMTDEKNVKNLR